MRVIELWTNTPMRFGKGGNVMTTHLVELPAREDRAPQTWHQSPGKPPEQCISLSMEATPMGVVVSIQRDGGSITATLVHDFCSANVVSSVFAARATPEPQRPLGLDNVSPEGSMLSAPLAQPQQKGKRR
jgi:hypothetical protein